MTKLDCSSSVSHLTSLSTSTTAFSVLRRLTTHKTLAPVVHLLLLLLLLLLLVHPVSSNVEKAIFLGPPAIPIPRDGYPNIDLLRLIGISPELAVLRTRLAATFPNDTAPIGVESWFLLDHLSPGRRYEVRVCWPATQPTAFKIDPYPLQTVFGSPELISSLAAYSQTRQRFAERGSRRAPSSSSNDIPPAVSTLFLRISAAADYFTTDASLMANVPPVAVDIILDPYLLNVFPRSLIPTAAYILVVAVVASYVSAIAWRWLRKVGDDQASRSESSSREQSHLAKKAN